MRIYFVYADDDEYGVAVAANSLREAKRIAYGSGNIDADWIDLRVRWVREGDVSGIEESRILNSKEGLERKGYAFLEADCKCGHPYCHQVVDGEMMCDDCYGKISNQQS